LLRSLKLLYVDLATFDSTALGIMRRSLPFCSIEGIASLIPKTPAQEAAARSQLRRFYAVGSKVIYSTLLSGASFLMLIVPFGPMYIGYVLRLQEYALPGEIIRGVIQGGYISGIVVNRGGRAFIYATRWVIFLVVALIGIYLFVQLGTYIFNNYFALQADR
jgi:hypothetical protein